MKFKMALKLQIVASVFSLSAIFTQPTVEDIYIDIEGIGKVECPPIYVEPMTEIAELIGAKEYKEAKTRLSKGSRDFCNTFSWLRGFCEWQTGNVENAITDLTSGTVRNYSNGTIINAILVDLLLSAEKEKEAQNRIKDMYSSELIALGERLCSRRKFDDALMCYSKAFMKYEPSVVSPTCYISRGNCYAKMEKFELSLANFKQALTIYPTWFDQRGTKDGHVQVLFINGLFDAGFFNMTMERMDYLKNEEDVALAMDEILKKKKNYDEAHQLFSHAIKRYSSNAVLYETRGHNYWRMKKFDKAIEDFQKAKELNPSLKKSWISLLKVLLLTEHYAQAMRVLEDFDKLALPMKTSEITEVEGIRLNILKAKKEKKINDETEK